MAASLPSEFGKFERYRRNVGQILGDTKGAFEEITSSGHFEPGQISFIEIPETEEECLNDILDKPPCLVILGQSCYAKAVVVNEILGENILPQDDNADQPGSSCRMLRFQFGPKSNVSIVLPDSFELVNENLHDYDVHRTTIAKEDLELKGEAQFDPYLRQSVLEVCLNHMLFQDGAQLVVSPCNCIGQNIVETYSKCVEGVLPIVVYALSSNTLTTSQIQDLQDLRNSSPEVPIFFVHVQPPGLNELTESAKDCFKSAQARFNSTSQMNNHNGDADYTADMHSHRQTVSEQLCDIGYLKKITNNINVHAMKSKNFDDSSMVVESELVENFDNFSTILLFVRHILQSHLVTVVTILNNAHLRCLKMFITTAFDMARDMMITPRRIRYAKDREISLYASLLEIANKKQEELKDLIIHTVTGMKEELLKEAADFIFVGIELKENEGSPQSKDVKKCTMQIQDMVLGRLNNAVAGKLIGSVNCLRDSYVGTLSRCLESLERSEVELEPSASLALKQILNAAYQVEVHVNTSSSIVRIILEKMKQVIRAMPWNTPPKLDAEWKMKVAAEMIDSLSESKLAKNICSQFRTRLNSSHDAFNQSMNQLEAKHSGRLEKTEEQRMKVRKVHAPKLARLSLESTSLKDVVLHGMPQMGREIGRGQYGVVYACDSWGSFSPCALKSVVPPDDKHWNDLALEFHYTRTIPEHDRIVALRGSVIDIGFGSGPAVLLIMDRLQRDLYAAIKMGLDLASRLQVAIDVVDGIRYLHSQGLVHRDIKLKNVLLDKHNRAKITDLGFCKPEAMMSGSVVGTPIHMAPELFTGRYDNSVDVYAFGILFWYISAGHVRLPSSYEQCASKDHLWNAVRRGVRPERLSQFDEESWKLMQSCWASEPLRRPLLGDVHTVLQRMHERASRQPVMTTKQSHPAHMRKMDKKYRLT
ncbi:dual serine/threonine and tyrosine protein kinase-like [Glandiceps talaboti]